MRKTLIVVWLLIPAGLLAYHYGPGQEALVLDEAEEILRAAEAHVERGEWAEAVGRYDLALGKLPETHRDQIRRVRLAKAKAQMLAAQLPLANVGLESLLNELVNDPAADPQVVRETRAALASSQYYMTWLKRLEGAPREEWGPYIDGARQNYRHLAESALAEGDAQTAGSRKEDLESSIRLARMNLSDLQALPLPSQ